MALKYRIVLKRDMSKGAAADAKLFYGQVRSIEKTDFKKLCELVSGYCTAKKGEVELVVDGLINIMKNELESGNIVQMGAFGNFRMLAGSRGSATLRNFDPSMFKKGRIVFTPGAILQTIISKPTFMKLEPFEDPDENPNGGVERPGIL